MTRSLQDLEGAIRGLDEKIEPVAKRPVDLADPDWAEKLRSGPAPLDEAGVRSAAEALILELIEGYLVADAAWRAGLRELLRRFESFAWAATVPLDGGTAQGFRAHLVLFSLKDQGKDPRDATLWLGSLRETAREGGVDAGPILREIAALSSDEDRYGWGSTRKWLEDAA